MSTLDDNSWALSPVTCVVRRAWSCPFPAAVHRPPQQDSTSSRFTLRWLTIAPVLRSSEQAIPTLGPPSGLPGKEPAKSGPWRPRDEATSQRMPLLPWPKSFTAPQSQQKELPSGSGRSPGEGNGNPLQYSCLENHMEGGAWWATVHGVAKSRTRLSDFTFT